MPPPSLVIAISNLSKEDYKKKVSFENKILETDKWKKSSLNAIMLNVTRESCIKLLSLPQAFSSMTHTDKPHVF